MKVKIREDAPDYYSIMSADFGWDTGWENIFSYLKGRWVEVDTNHLHKYEYYLKPIKGLFDEPLRVDEDFIEDIMCDVRYGKARCDFCNSISLNRKICTNCGRKDYLNPFFEDDEEKAHKNCK
ncbi:MULTISPECIES: hypothetical protein [Exiguobacterium]|uniref:hypothetical protein n=1 Tax=Exiguobacterium TaxID=33986 RepID=UPI001BEABC6C|nr:MULTISPECIES: hypothetical protein [Exiguobacterium]MCT4776361.1 hypothetical protein [Exiguobacterium aquaticum]MCT4789241.1 hypothetical protein [Exiguobacterium mexicanum]